MSIEPVITCAGTDRASEKGLKRTIGAITLDTSEKFYFDYANKSAMMPSQIPLLYASFTFGTISASPAWNAANTNRSNGNSFRIPLDASYYTLDARISFESRVVSEEMHKKIAAAARESWTLYILY